MCELHAALVHQALASRKPQTCTRCPSALPFKASASRRPRSAARISSAWKLRTLAPKHWRAPKLLRGAGEPIAPASPSANEKGRLADLLQV